MIIELSTLDQKPRSFDIELSAGDVDLELENARTEGQITVRGQVIQRAAETDVTGHISGAVEADCVRCLAPVKSQREIDFEAVFVRPEHFASEKEREVTGADLDTDVLEENTLDLRELVREQLVLDLPIQIFCREDCKGLCPKCGNNRNLIDCSCNDTDADPRWAALKNLR